MVHDLLMLTLAKELEAKAWGKGRRCQCFSHAPPGCTCPGTLHEPPLLPTPSSSDSWDRLPGSSEPDFFTALSFVSSPVLSPSAHSAFQALPQQISFAPLPEHHRPLGCDGGFASWQHILSSALAHLWGSSLFPSLPKGIHSRSH